LAQKILVRREHLEALFNGSEAFLIAHKNKLIDEHMDLVIGNQSRLSLKNLRKQARLIREVKRFDIIIEELRADRQLYLGSKSKSAWMISEEKQSHIHPNLSKIHKAKKTKG
jgi:hypothetical protein